MESFPCYEAAALDLFDFCVIDQLPLVGFGCESGAKLLVYESASEWWCAAGRSQVRMFERREEGLAS